MTKREFDECCRPFLKAREDRRSVLTLQRQMPIDGGPADVVAIMEEYYRWLGSSELPKLYIDGEPGFLSTEMRLDFDLCSVRPGLPGWLVL